MTNPAGLLHHDREGRDAAIVERDERRAERDMTDVAVYDGHLWRFRYRTGAPVRIIPTSRIVDVGVEENRYWIDDLHAGPYPYESDPDGWNVRVSLDTTGKPQTALVVVAVTRLWADYFADLIARSLP